MKVLFAVNNDNVSEAIVKKYQKEYKKILSYKNVYYFNAILRELQKDKSYSRIVISEDLEPFANNNYNSIDKFLFEKYSNIVEEAKSPNNEPIEVILICADRRKKTDDMLGKIYKKGIYNAIIGQERSIDEVCRLIDNPRNKEEARIYYNIKESELGEEESENSVSEAEVQNILAHYKRLGKNEDKYVESFNNIVAQYNDAQLRIIIKYLPINVKAVLEERSSKYQQLVTTYVMNGIDAKQKTANYKAKLQDRQSKKEEKKDEIEKLIKERNIKDVVIPRNLTTQNVQKIVVPSIVKPQINKDIIVEPEKINVKNIEDNVEEENQQETNEIQEVQVPVKKGRGRPRKNPLPNPEEEKTKRGRGRPRKQEQKEVQEKIDEPQTQNEEIDLFNLNEEKNDKIEEVDLFNLNEENQELKEVDLFNMNEEKNQEPEEVDLFNMNEEESEEPEEVDLFNMDEEEIQEPEEVDLFNMDEEEIQEPEEVDLFNMNEEANQEPEEVDLFNIDQEPSKLSENNGNFAARNIISIPDSEDTEDNRIINTNYTNNSNYKALLTASKKVVAFVGTTKNGTSFIVNNTAEMLASMGIETAILDMTKTKNAYYIYTNNEESLRVTSRNCMEKLQNGVAEGIKVKKNLTVFTEMPGEEKEYDIDVALSTLLQNYSAVLIDTDFETPNEVFERVQELYLVQTMDVLTIQPLTAFLRNLKSKNILAPEKLKIVINKSQRVRSLSIKTLIGGMSCYNSPSMTYMTELFNKDNIRYCEIPFEMQNYVKYLESLVNCSISLNGYTKQFINALRNLANMVYPLVNRQTDSQTNRIKQREPFSSEINETLNKMKNRY